MSRKIAAEPDEPAIPAATVTPLRIADARAQVRHVFLRDLTLAARIGVHRHERAGPQSVRINLDLAVRDERNLRDDLANVVCYEQVADEVRRIAASRHFNLVETLAEEIAERCLRDCRIRAARVRVEKLDVFEDAASVGVEIERFQTSP